MAEPSGPSRTSGSLRPGTEVDHFRIMRALGVGGMAEVYLARDTRLGRKVALKVIRSAAIGQQEDLDRFLFEARATARFSHPHIVTIHAVGEVDGRPYVALEYLEGQSLRERADQERLSFTEAARVALAVADALRAAHEEGILHRDLKPANVMLCRDGRIRVLDFGLALALALPPLRGEDETPPAPDAVDASRIEDPFESQHRGVRGTPAYMAPEQWAERALTPAADVWALGVMLFELATGRRPYRGTSRVDLGMRVLSKDPAPAVDPDTGVPSDLAELLADCLRKNPDHRPTAGEVAQRLRRLLAADREGMAGDECPFRGLLPFDERHRHLFFGRDREIAEFVERMRSQPVLPVVGLSGAGKSSFVQAGVIPRLRERGPLVVLQVRPGHRPFLSLAHRIVAARRQASGSVGMSVFGVSAQAGATATSHETDRGEADWLAEQLQGAPHLLNLVLQRLADRREASVLLFVDQLEELVTLEPDAEVREAFMQSICAAADDPQGHVRVVLTVREEFLSRLARNDAVRQALSQITVLQSPGREALQEILSRPLSVTSYRFDDPALVERMVDEVQGEIACLPLLQFAGQMLWDRRERESRTLRSSTYESMGGVAGALAQHADGVLAAMSPQEVQLARTMLLRLVTADRTRWSLTRSRVVESLDPAASGVLKQLIGARLLSVKHAVEDGEGEVELVHESLIATWGRLSRWIDESREELVFLGEVSQAAELWERRGCRDEEVWQGAALREARKAATSCTTGLSDSARRFLAAGEEMEARQGRHRRWAVVGVILALAAISLFTLVNAILAQRQRAVAEDARDRAQDAELGARQNLARTLADRAVLSSSSHEAALYAMASLQEHENADARGVLAGLLDRSGPRLAWQSRPGISCTDLRYSPDGRYLACAGYMSDVVVWDMATGDQVARFGGDAAAWRLAYSPDGNTLAAGRMDGEVRLYDPLEGTEVARLQGPRDTVVELTYSPDGERIAGASLDGTVVVWDLPGGGEAARLQGRCLQHYGLAFSPDGGQLATGCIHGEVLLWQPDSLEEPVLLGTHDRDVSGVAFTDDGLQLVTSSDDGEVAVWDVATATEVRRFAGCEGRSGALDLLADGRNVVLGCLDGMVRLFDVDGGEELMSWHAHQRYAAAATASPDGRTLATSGQEGSLHLWDLATGRRTGTLGGHTAGFSGLHFTSLGDRLITSDHEGSFRVWRAEDGAEVSGFAAEGAIYPLFGPDDRRVVTGSRKGVGAVYDTQTGERLSVLKGHERSTWPLRFCPDGRVWTGGDDHTARLWDGDTGQPVRSLQGKDGSEFWVVVSRDCTLGASMEIGGPVWIWDMVAQRRVARVGGDSSYQRMTEFSRDNHLVAVGRTDGSLAVHDAADGRLIQQLAGHEGAVTTVDFSPDGRTLVSGGTDKLVRLWDLNSGGETAQLLHGDRVAGVAFTRDGRGLATIAEDRTVRMWHLELRATTPVMRGHDALVGLLAFTDDGATVVSAAYDRTVRRWDQQSGRELDRFELPHQVIVPRALSRDGRFLVAADLEENVFLYDTVLGERLGQVEGGWEKISAAVAFSDGSGFVACGSDGGVQRWNTADSSLTPIDLTFDERLGFHPMTLALSPDESALAVAEWSGQILLVDLSSGVAFAQARGAQSISLEFSPDASLLAATQLDGSIRLLGVPSRGATPVVASAGEGVWSEASRMPMMETVGRLVGHDNVAIRARFSPDGRLLASTGYDKMVRVWDVENRRELARLPHQHQAAAAFSPNSTLLVTAQDDGTARLWDLTALDVPVDDLMARVAEESGLVWDGRAVVADPARLTLQWEFGEMLEPQARSVESESCCPGE